jgi:hypothetical protein
MLNKLHLRSMHTQTDTTTPKTGHGAKDTKAKSTASAMPSSGLGIGSFAQRARNKLAAHRGEGNASAHHAFDKLGVDHAPVESAKKHDDTVLEDVTPEQRNAQYAATAQHNQAFRAHLRGMGLETVHNSGGNNAGSNNNCAIYSLVDIAAPKLNAQQRHQAVDEIRASFDRAHPQEQGRMLLLDSGRGGHGPALMSLVNHKFGVNMEVGVVQAGVEDAHPVTHLGTMRSGDAASTGKPVTHKGVVWDQHGHFEALRQIAPKPVETQAQAQPQTQTQTQTPKPATSAKGAPFAKLAAIGKWRGGAPGAKASDGAGKSGKTNAAKTESYQLDVLDFKTDTADWSKDTQKAVGEASKLKETPDPKFILPPRKMNIGQAYDRSKPGFTAIESLGIRPFGNLFNAAAAGLHDPLKSVMQGVGGGVGGIHDAMLGGLNSHALVASMQKGKRYGQQLDDMLKKDVEKFQKDPQLDTLILTKDKKGNWAYDMKKVAKLAASDKPEHKEASAHAKNVFLTAYIKDEVAGKRQNRATYELTRNVVGMASAGAILGGTLGMAAAPAGAAAIGAKSAGLGLGFANALDGAKGVRGLKQRMRDDKEREIDSRFLNKRMDLKNVAYPKSVPQEAINGTHAVIKDNARIEANDVLFRSLLTGQHIDEEKSTEAKKGRADVAAKHAYGIVDYHVEEFAAGKDDALEDFHRHLSEPGLSQRDKGKRLESLIKNDPSLRQAYDLMRDVGMRSSEATVAIHKLVMRKIETKMAKDPDRIGAATQASQKYDGKPEAGDVRDMRGVLRRH